MNLFGADGKQLASYGPQPAWNNNTTNQVAIKFSPSAVRSYFGGKLVGQQLGLNIYEPVIQDRLGSVGKYYPYGEERNSPQLPNDQVKFATYTRDSATGNDYADQRYYTSTLGRFMTPDPHQSKAALKNPQSWNRYSYVAGDPTNLVDPLGNYAEDPSSVDCLANAVFDASVSGEDCDYSESGIGVANSGSIHLSRDWAILDQLTNTGAISDWLTNAGTFAITLDTSTLSLVDEQQLEKIIIAAGGTFGGPAFEGVVTLAAAGYGLYELWEWYAHRPKIQPSDCPQDQREITPTTDPTKFDPVRGAPCKVDPSTGEIWCSDPAHNNDHYEVYKNKKDYDNGDRTRSVWNNGCIRQKF